MILLSNIYPALLIETIMYLSTTIYVQRLDEFLETSYASFKGPSDGVGDGQPWHCYRVTPLRTMIVRFADHPE